MNAANNARLEEEGKASLSRDVSNSFKNPRTNCLPDKNLYQIFQVEIIKFEDMKRKPEPIEGFKQNPEEFVEPETEVIGPPIPKSVASNEGNQVLFQAYYNSMKQELNMRVNLAHLKADNFNLVIRRCGFEWS